MLIRLYCLFDYNYFTKTLILLVLVSYGALVNVPWNFGRVKEEIKMFIFKKARFIKESTTAWKLIDDALERLNEDNQKNIDIGYQVIYTIKHYIQTYSIFITPQDFLKLRQARPLTTKE